MPSSATRDRGEELTLELGGDRERLARRLLDDHRPVQVGNACRRGELPLPAVVVDVREGGGARELLQQENLGKRARHVVRQRDEPLLVGVAVRDEAILGQDQRVAALAHTHVVHESPQFFE